MGKIDAYAKTFMGDPEVFAEFFNLLFWQHGDDLFVEENSLEEKDSGVTVVLSGHLKKWMERRNDLVRQGFLHGMCVRNSVILCLEIQSYVRYDQSLQNAICLSVRSVQAEQILAHLHEQEHGKEKSPLLVMEEQDVLPLMVQAVLYLGDKPWTAKDSLLKLMDTPLQQLEKYMINCPACVVSLVDLTDDAISFLKTELHALAIFIKYSKDKEKLQHYLATDPMLQHLSGDVVRLIKECTHINLKKKILKEGNNMCQAIDEMVEMGRATGYLQGIKARDEKNQKILLRKDNTIMKMGKQLEKKENQLEKKDSQLEKKDSQLKKKDSQIENIIQYFISQNITTEEIAHIMQSSVDDVEAIVSSIPKI